MSFIVFVAEILKFADAHEWHLEHLESWIPREYVIHFHSTLDLPGSLNLVGPDHLWA